MYDIYLFGLFFNYIRCLDLSETGLYYISDIYAFIVYFIFYTALGVQPFFKVVYTYMGNIHLFGDHFILVKKI